MLYTGHKKRLINGQNIVQHIWSTMEQESQFYKVPLPTPEQAALVISSMRMHHTMMHAADYDFSELGHPDEVTKFWPMQSSIGRFFRDSAGDILSEHKLKS